MKKQATAQGTAAAEPQLDVAEQPDEPNEEDLLSAEASGIEGGEEMQAEEMQAAPSAAVQGRVPPSKARRKRCAE